MTTISSTKPRHARGFGRSKIFAMLGATAAALVLAACHVVGSGTVVSSDGKGRATFTFVLSCPAKGRASGVLTYIDSPARVMIHAFPTGGSTYFHDCNPPSTTTSASGDGLAAQPQILSGPFDTTFTGTYTSLNSSSTGTFSLSLSPGGTDSTVPGFFCLALYGGSSPYNGYTNAGPIQWGNIVVTH